MIKIELGFIEKKNKPNAIQHLIVNHLYTLLFMIMLLKKIINTIALTLSSMALLAQTPSFEVVPLGVKGGTDERNLSSYLLAPTGTTQYIALDAGTIYAGLEKAVAQKTFKITAPQALRQYIKGYFISHAHLDHVSGLIINSPGDSAKTVYATQDCMTMMQNHYFNDKTWVNFGDSGVGFPLKKYHFETLIPEREIPVTNTEMTVKAFTLSHIHPYQSTAFLVKSQDSYALYLGDTGPDALEKGHNLQNLWKNIAPLIQSKQLKGIFIEVSFPNEQPDKLLFGHLTPNWLMQEMQVLADLAGKEAVKGLNIIVTHIKPPLSSEKKIIQQLKQNNPLGLKLIFPQQGKRFNL